MGNFGIQRFAVIFAIVALAYGRPLSEYEPERNQTEEIIQARLEVEMLREERPCYARLMEVKLDIMEYDDIVGDPHYIPECDKEGVKWREAQCDHHDAGACFCVHEDNGEVLEHTRDLNLNKEALRCGNRSRIEFRDHSAHECFHQRDEFHHMQREFGVSLSYYPECTATGKFMAMQRDDRSIFFCVDTDTGVVIPETATEAGAVPPLTEYICQAYDQVWQDFKKWNASHDVETHESEFPTDQSACRDGFTFTECGCPLLCTHKAAASDFEKDCSCKPSCVCPRGKLELDGRCVTLEECHEAKPASKVPQADKLDDLTNGDFSRWKEYQANNPNAILETYNSLPMQELVYASGPIAYDVNPNARMLYNEGPPPEEPSGEQPQGGYYGAEPVPIQGQRFPFLITVLQQGGPSPDEVEEVHEDYTTQKPYIHWEEEQYEPQEPTESEEEYQVNPPVEEEFSEEELEYLIPEEEEPHLEETEHEYESNQEFDNEREGFPDVEPSQAPTEEEGFFPEEERHEPLLPERGEPSENVEQEVEEEIEPEAEYEEEYPTELPEPEDEVDERLIKEGLTDHQTELSSVPQPEHDVANEHQVTQPCEEMPDSSSSPPQDQNNYETEEDEERAVVDRVLTEKGIIPPVEATLEKQSQSIKKAING